MITLGTADGRAELTVVNDGVAGKSDEGRAGTELTGLEERLAGVGGSLTTRLDRSCFVLTAALPENGAL